jgi:hypothetical protein
VAVASARSYVLGQYPLHFETAADWAGALADLELFQLPQSYINDYAPALARVDATASRSVIDEAFPQSKDVDIVLIGDASKIRGVAAKFGAVSESQLERSDYEIAPRP